MNQDFEPNKTTTPPSFDIDQFENSQKYEQYKTTKKASALPKHTYPGLIKLFGLCTSFLSLYVIYPFIKNELHKHTNFCKIFTQAKHELYYGDPKKAEVSFKKITEQYPTHHKAKLHLSQAYFAQSLDNEEFCERAMQALPQTGISNKELSELKAFVPVDYHDHFDTCFYQDKPSLNYNY